MGSLSAALQRRFSGRRTSIRRVLWPFAFFVWEPKELPAKEFASGRCAGRRGVPNRVSSRNYYMCGFPICAFGGSGKVATAGRKKNGTPSSENTRGNGPAGNLISWRCRAPCTAPIFRRSMVDERAATARFLRNPRELGQKWPTGMTRRRTPPAKKKPRFMIKRGF